VPPGTDATPARESPTIVFLHGTRLTGAQWAIQVDALGGDYRCLTPDLLGHGLAADRPFTLSAAAEAIASTLEAEAGGLATEPTGPRALAFRALGWIFETLDETWLRRINVWFFGWRYRPAIAEPIIAGGFFFRGGAVAVRSLVGERFRPRLARFRGPTLILNGEFDLLFRLSQRSFMDAADDARAMVIPRATHLTNIDRPEVFTAALRQFVRAVDRPVE
jgi:pimeloyl-ACP methyl ester carboxylesterase